jgi:hypothetical protein
VAKRLVNSGNSKVRNVLIQVGWKVGGAITVAHGFAVIAKGTCPGCGQNWSLEHRKCVGGLFPNEKEQCTHRECGM